MNRKNHMPLILSLGFLLFLFIIVDAFRHTRVYMVYSADLGHFFMIGALILAIILLLFKGV